jgi:hypothetical protein
MGDIINLRRARKARARAADRAAAAVRAAQFGETRAGRDQREAKSDLASARLDGARRDRGTDPDADPDA